MIGFMSLSISVIMNDDENSLFADLCDCLLGYNDSL